MRSSENIDPLQLAVSVWKQSHYSTKPLISFVPSQCTTRLEILVRTLRVLEKQQLDEEIERINKDMQLILYSPGI